jgi:hypothetical protein
LKIPKPAGKGSGIRSVELGLGSSFYLFIGWILPSLPVYPDKQAFFPGAIMLFFSNFLLKSPKKSQKKTIKPDGLYFSLQAMPAVAYRKFTR